MIVEVSSSVADTLLQGLLCVARSTEPPCGVCREWPKAHRDAGYCSGVHGATHLVPVAIPPKCETCGGSGRAFALFADVEGACPDCVGGYPLNRQVTLTTECGVCRGSGRLIVRIDHGYRVGSEPYVTGANVDTSYWHAAHDEIEDCWQCHKARQIPRCEGTLRAVLPIYGPGDEEMDHAVDHLCFVPGDLQLMLANEEPDVSHLLAVCEWVPGQFALLLDNLKAL